MNKKLLGIIIPYYKNTEVCETEFRQLLDALIPQLTDDMLLYIYEDGQKSDWLWEIASKIENITIESNPKNKGVSFARNQGLDYLIDKVEYILFLDSDDAVDNDYLKIVYEYCADRTHEIIETSIVINGVKAKYDPKKIRNGVAGSCLQTKIIGKHRFKNKLQVCEDTTFMNEVIDLSKYRKKHCKTNYYYQYGINPNSLIKRYNNNKIGKERKENE